MKKAKEISAVIIAKNAVDLIKDCLESIVWCDEIILIDNESTDDTREIAKKYNAKIYVEKGGNYSIWRNRGAKEASRNWLLYIDVDERVSESLKDEIVKKTKGSEYNAYAIPRRNILLGYDMRHGGWSPDYVLRLIKRNSLISWRGELHEQPEIKGRIGKLKNKLDHISHRTLSEMVEKTNKWSNIEARLLFESGHPPMNTVRFISVGLREFWFRGVRERGYLDGTVGWIEIIYQVFSRLITYMKLWELQIKKSK